MEAKLKVSSRPPFLPILVSSAIAFVSLNADGWVSTRSRKSSLITTSFTGNGSYTVPAGFSLLIIKSWGAGGGGGANNASESGHGGAGGYAYTGTLTVTPGTVYSVIVGVGGQAGKCAAPPLGGTGAHAGGNGGETTDGVDGSGTGVGGAGGTGVHNGGAGKWGGGGGGGMQNNQRGGGGGGSTQVTDNTGSITILVAGGGGGGGGGNNSGSDQGGDGGAGCAQAGGNSAPSATKGGAGGAGACFGPFTANGILKVPANSVEAGTGVAVGGDDGGNCASTGLGGDGKVIFELSK